MTCLPPRIARVPRTGAQPGRRFREQARPLAGTTRESSWREPQPRSGRGPGGRNGDRRAVPGCDAAGVRAADHRCAPRGGRLGTRWRGAVRGPPHAGRARGDERWQRGRDRGVGGPPARQLGRVCAARPAAAAPMPPRRARSRPPTRCRRPAPARPRPRPAAGPGTARRAPRSCTCRRRCCARAWGTARCRAGHGSTTCRCRSRPRAGTTALAQRTHDRVAADRSADRSRARRLAHAAPRPALLTPGAGARGATPCASDTARRDPAAAPRPTALP
jgi:hypothetical protein